MSIFGSIMEAIFGGPAAAATVSGSGASASATPVASGSNSAMSSVDVAVVLDKIAKTKGEKLDWRRSIVDLMKLLDLDSSLKNRKELAQELKYDGDMGDSAKMNIWLHKQVMTKLAQNGGVVPADLKD